MTARRVALEASMSRPSSSIVPCRSSSSASSSPSGSTAWSSAADDPDEDAGPDEDAEPDEDAGSDDDAGTRALPAVAVVPRAEVPAGVERLPAQGARRPARGDDPLGP